MRLFLFVLVLFAIPLIVFLVFNDRELVTIYLGTDESAVYRDVPVWIVVLLSVAVGAGLAGLIAIAEGAAIRLANRKLSRELHALETEVNLLRTESTGKRPPRIEEAAPRPAPAVAPDPAEEPLPTAPVYSGDEFDPYRED